MKVRFFLTIEVSEGSACLEKILDLPFAPRLGDRLVFCDALCCEQGVLIPPDANIVYHVKDAEWLVDVVDKEWAAEVPLDGLVQHFLDCGFDEIDVDWSVKK